MATLHSQSTQGPSLTAEQIRAYLSKTQWTPMEDSPNHYEHADFQGYVPIEGDDAYLLDELLTVPWAIIRSQDQLEQGLSHLKISDQ